MLMTFLGIRGRAKGRRVSTWSMAQGTCIQDVASVEVKHKL